jgi:hypothetical protein
MSTCGEVDHSIATSEELLEGTQVCVVNLGKADTAFIARGPATTTNCYYCDAVTAKSGN